MDLFDLSGKTALVTGGTRGIGLMMARGLLQAGARVYISSRKPDACDAAAAELSEFGEVTAIPADLSAEEECLRLAAEVSQREQALPILVNNAGATWGAPAEDHPLEAWDKLMNVNLTGLFLLSQRVAKRCMIPAKWGRIVNVASIAGLLGQDPRFAPTAAYTATKHGVVGLTRQLAAEWGVHGITVNAICPGFFPSKMTKATLATAGELVKEWTPTRRLGNDEDLKGLAVLLASEASRHINGQAIAVDGGAGIV